MTEGQSRKLKDWANLFLVGELYGEEERKLGFLTKSRPWHCPKMKRKSLECKFHEMRGTIGEHMFRPIGSVIVSGGLFFSVLMGFHDQAYAADDEFGPVAVEEVSPFRRSKFEEPA